MKIVKLSIFCAAFGLFVFACTSDVRPIVNKDLIAANQNAANVNRSANVQPSAPANALADARKIYTESCANCHKEDGTGGKKEIDGKTINVDNLTTAKMAAMADDKYFDYIKNGVPDEGMPAFKNQLSDEQIRSVIKFIRSDLQKK